MTLPPPEKRSSLGSKKHPRIVQNDHLGTPQKMTDQAVNTVWSADYLPFGLAGVTVNTVESNLRFAGQYYDSETGLHYNYHRYYDPKLGRYLRADPIGLDGGFNPYIYVLDPITWIDPEGLEAEHTSGARPSTKGKHQKGKRRKRIDRGGEKGDEARRPPRKRPPGHKGPWPECGEKCKKVIKVVQDTVTGVLTVITVIICSQSPVGT